MGSFKMRNRPKKPAEPMHVSMNIGNCVALDYLLGKIEVFKAKYPDVDPADIMIEAESNDYYGSQIELNAPPEAQSIYDKKLEAYRAEFRVYEEWRKKHKNQIEKHQAEKKKATAKTKLEQTQTMLNKKLAEVKAKLEKA